MIQGLLFDILIDLSFIALPISIILSKEKNLYKSLRKIGFLETSPKKLAVQATKLFLMLIAVSFILSITLTALGIDDLEAVANSLQESRIHPAFLLLVTLRVISEETFFRGFLVKEIGVLGSTAIFAIFHFGYGSLAEIIGAFVLGLILAKGFQLNKNLYPNIIAHLAYNLIAISVA